MRWEEDAGSVAGETGEADGTGTVVERADADDIVGRLKGYGNMGEGIKEGSIADMNELMVCGSMVGHGNAGGGTIIDIRGEAMPIGICENGVAEAGGAQEAGLGLTCWFEKEEAMSARTLRLLGQIGVNVEVVVDIVAVVDSVPASESEHEWVAGATPASTAQGEWDMREEEASDGNI